MNRERFHNELAMRLGYERIVKDGSILISVEDSEVPWVTLKVQGHENISFNASDLVEEMEKLDLSEMEVDVKVVFNALRYDD